MSIQQTIPTQQVKIELEKNFRMLRNVQAAHVDFDEVGEVYAIGIFSDGARHPKDIKRDVEETFRNIAGYRINHNKISIVEQYVEEGEAEAATETEEQILPSRIRFLTAYQVQRANGIVEGIVMLEHGEEAISETIQVQQFEMELELMIANATAQGLMRILTDYSIRIDHIRTVPMGDQEVICVMLSTIHKLTKAPQTYVGACLKSKDLLSSVSRATLDAINRKLEILN